MSDTGVGIPSDQIEQVFEPFFQVERGPTRRYPGIGLGLAIARDLAHAMNGEVRLESTVGKGTHGPCPVACRLTAHLICNSDSAATQNDKVVCRYGKQEMVHALPYSPSDSKTQTQQQEAKMLYRMTTSSPIFGLRREIDRLFDDTFARDGNSFTPAVDIKENDNEIRLELELAGLKPEDVEITAENGVLTVRGEKRIERKEGDETPLPGNRARIWHIHAHVPAAARHRRRSDQGRVRQRAC